MPDNKSKIFSATYPAQNPSHPIEDRLLISDKYPIYAVADGVTLALKDKEYYPDPSPVAEVAEIFCKTAVEESEQIYNDLTSDGILKVFKEANTKLGEYNKKHAHKSPDQDLFHTTASLAVVKENRVYWGNVGDSEINLFSRDKRRLFQTPRMQKGYTNHPPEREKMAVHEKMKLDRALGRNKISQDGYLLGYGVLTGESAALNYVDYGAVAYAKENLLFVITDGFTPYLELPKFINLFLEWPKDIEKVVRGFTQEMANKNPELFGKERSIIVVKL